MLLQMLARCRYPCDELHRPFSGDTRGIFFIYTTTHWSGSVVYTNSNPIVIGSQWSHGVRNARSIPGQVQGVYEVSGSAPAWEDPQIIYDL